MDEWQGYEIYEPTVGEVYSPGTMCRLKYDEDDEWMEQNCNGQHCSPEWVDVDRQFIYMRPVPFPSAGKRTTPNDTCLVWLAGKVDQAVYTIV